MKHSDLFRCSKEWSELERQIAALPDVKARGDAFEEFCLSYLKLTPEYQIKNIWPRGNFPTNVIDTLKLHGQKDQGIDLIAETVEGRLWAIQAKFRTNRKDTVPYKELSTFLAVSDRADYRLIISNTETLPHIVEIRKKCGEALIDRLEVLGKDFFDRLHQFIEQHKVVPPKPLTPKPHQEEAISKAIEHYKSNDRGQLIMACGTGKTLTSVWIAEQLKAQRILVMVPSLALMRQTISVWADNLKTIPFNFLCVCSDKSVAQDVENDLAVGSLWQMDLPVTTDSHQAKAVISKHIDKPLIVFSTYQSSDVLSNSVSGVKDFTFDLTICDEAHRTAGVGKGLFNLVLDDKHIRSHKRLFMTATPRIFARKVAKQGEGEDVDLFSMSDVKQYGTEFYRLYFRDAIDRGLLSDYKVVIAFVTDKEIADMIHKKDHVQIESENLPQNREAQSFAKQIAFLKAMSKYDIKHTISFHSRVAYAKAFSNQEHQGIESVNRLVKQTSNSHPDIKSFHVNGKLAAGERATIMKDFVKSQYSIVSNARCLTEGVDIPSVDGVLFFDPKYRLTDIVQATGRALRLHEGKKYGYLIVPIFAKEEQEVSDLLESSDFKQVWSVIKAMRFQDERLDDVINHFRVLTGEEKAKADNLAGEKESLEERLNESLLFANIPRKMSSESFIRQVDARVIEELGTSWDYNFGLLKAYRKQFPDRWPKQVEEFPKGYKLGWWCQTQRQYYKKKKNLLTSKQVTALEQMGFPWGLDRARKGWDLQYKQLVSFREENPSRWPTKNEEYPKGNRLGQWVKEQRRLYRMRMLLGKRSEALKKIGFVFSLGDNSSGEGFLYDQLKNLVEFRIQHPNRWPITSEEFPKGNKLGQWLKAQQAEYVKGALSSERVSGLRGAGYIFKGLLSWQEQYNNLVEFRKIFPDRWPAREDEFPQGNKLGKWVALQKRFLKRKALLKNNENLLIGIGLHPESLELKSFRHKAWHEGYNHLQDFRRQHPNRWPMASEEFPKGCKLGEWVKDQKRRNKNGCLKKERKELLEKIGFPLGENTERQKAWELQCEWLLKFREQYPDRWPKQHEEFPEGNKVGRWINKQRVLYNQGRLSQERTILLERAGFPWSKKNRASWSTHYEHLLQFRKDNPNRWPTQTEEHADGNKLGRWVNYQRVLFGQGRLPEDRKNLLNQIGFEWRAREGRKSGESQK